MNESVRRIAYAHFEDTHFPKQNLARCASFPFSISLTGANASEQDGSKKDATQEDLLGIAAGEGCAICVFVCLLYWTKASEQQVLLNVSYCSLLSFVMKLGTILIHTYAAF